MDVQLNLGLRKKIISSSKLLVIKKLQKVLQWRLKRLRFSSHIPYTVMPSCLMLYHNKRFYFKQMLNSLEVRSTSNSCVGLTILSTPIKKNFLKFIKVFFNFNLKRQKMLVKEFTFTLYSKMLTFAFKVGKKAFWEVSLSSLFNSLCLKLRYTRTFILLKIFIRLYTRVELVKVRSRKRITFIPLFVTFKRSIFLALKWLFLSAKALQDRISLKAKLLMEIVQLLTLKSCFSLKRVEENNLNSFKNRSNLHYRWKKTR